MRWRHLLSRHNAIGAGLAVVQGVNVWVIVTKALELFAGQAVQ